MCIKPYKADNAIIMAAGTSSRFAPLSYEKPKGLLEVKGEVLIERQIRQLHEAGIYDITIVVGYLKEQFFYLKDKYGVEIVINEDFNIYNNTSSLIRVIDRLKNTYICSSDNYFTVNPFEEYVDHAYYSAVFIPGKSDEWGLEYINKTDGSDSELITGINHNPVDMWCMMGHVFFSEEFSKVFVPLLKEQYEYIETREHLWESLYERFINTLPIYIRKYDPGIIMEFDSLYELRAFDDKYINNSGSKILEQICRELNCQERDLKNITAFNKELGNLSFTFEYNNRTYLYNNKDASISLS